MKRVDFLVDLFVQTQLWLLGAGVSFNAVNRNHKVTIQQMIRLCIKSGQKIQVTFCLPPLVCYRSQGFKWRFATARRA
jgi:hypothetical protein